MTAKYNTLVHAINRHSGYGKPVAVYADTQAEARKKAIAIGWGGHAGDAQVTFVNVEEVPPCGCRRLTPRSGHALAPGSTHYARVLAMSDRFEDAIAYLRENRKRVQVQNGSGWLAADSYEGAIAVLRNAEPESSESAETPPVHPRDAAVLRAFGAAGVTTRSNSEKETDD